MAIDLVRRLLLFLVAAASALALAGCFSGPPPPGCEAGGPTGPQFSLPGQGTSPCPPPPSPPDCDGCITGDPHVLTFDGHRYDFQGAGEFVAVIDDTDGLEIQIRTAPRGTRVSSITAVAARLDGQRLSFEVEEGAVAVRVDGRVITLPVDQGLALEGGGVIGDVDGDIVVETADGSRLAVAPSGSFAGLYVDLADERNGRLRGLLGDADGERDNDLVTAEGTDIGLDPEFEVLYGEFGNSWRVDDTTTLFDYRGGESTATYQILDFPDRPATLDDLTPEQRAFAERVCAEAGVTDPAILDDCLLDVGLTGDESYALAAAEAQSRLQRDDRTVRVTGGDAVAWTAVLPGAVGSQSLQVDSAGHLLAQSSDLETGEPFLVALDLDDGAVAWTRRGVSDTCAVTPTDDGRILVMSPARHPLGGEDNVAATLLALDAATGEPIDGQSWTSDPDAPGSQRLSVCEGPPAVDGDTLVFVARGRLWMFDVGGAPEFVTFTDDLPGPTTRVATIDADAGVAHLGVEVERGRPALIAYDLDDGSPVEQLDLPGTAFLSRTPPVVVDDTMVVSTSDNETEGVNGHLIGVDRSGGDLEIAWVTQAGRDDPDGLAGPPSTMTAGPDQVVGWEAGRSVVGVDADDGTIVWKHRPSSFRNANAAPAVDDDGNAYFSTFGGAWLESVTAEGTLRYARSGDELFESGSSGVQEIRLYGPVVDGVLAVANATESGPNMVVIAVEVDQ